MTDWCVNEYTKCVSSPASRCCKTKEFPLHWQAPLRSHRALKPQTSWLQAWHCSFHLFVAEYNLVLSYYGSHWFFFQVVSMPDFLSCSITHQQESSCISATTCRSRGAAWAHRSRSSLSWYITLDRNLSGPVLSQTAALQDIRNPPDWKTACDWKNLASKSANPFKYRLRITQFAFPQWHKLFLGAWRSRLIGCLCHRFEFRQNTLTKTQT